MNRVFHTIPQGLDISAVYKQIEKAYTLDEYRKICVGFLLETISYIKQNKREEDYIISYILDYVENHYAEDIYLNLFAEKLKLTGAYISSYFKEKMNVNLSDYVNNYRIKKVVELTKNPQNKNLRPRRRGLNYRDQWVRRALPFARLLASTFLPLRVRMRFMKPCSLLR